jgi:hypothetical protein
LDAAGGEQGLDEALGRETAGVEDEREESRVVDVDVVERVDPRPPAEVGGGPGSSYRCTTGPMP